MKQLITMLIFVVTTVVGSFSTTTNAHAGNIIQDSVIQFTGSSAATSADSSAATTATIDAKKKKKPKKMKKKFCCKTASGTGCYVFGNASCNNCMSFCSGDMVIEPVKTMGSN